MRRRHLTIGHGSGPVSQGGIGPSTHHLEEHRMRGIGLRFVAGFLMLAVCGLALGADDNKAPEGWTALFNGKDFTGLKFFLPGKDADPAKTWSVKDGVIHCTGKPNGYFYSDKSFKNYTIRYDWRYPKEQPEKTTLNSGLLVHITGENKVWPYCIEAQGAYANHGQIYFVSFPKDAPKGTAKQDAEARKKALKPKEEWHTTEVTCKADGTVTVKINGIEVAEGKSDLKEGPIGFQSEGAAIEFKNIFLKEMK
jgi:hypothetical protein